ncbi:MAG: 3-hydroxyacyl-CoA dehydrogenase NAD-binding domain-containing protein [Deltaproteobacteria bacterium]|nr:3-hydroxyacyl-CoA dehydrogenase NAD-binding domain-containing protein [Deltaproteobacteria bacterium]
MRVKTIAILGTGTMSTGIAQVAAQTGHEVILWNRRETSVEQGLGRIRKGLDRLLKKERISQSDHDASLARVRGVAALEEAKTADIVIEAVSEDLELKQDLFERLSQICADEVVFASNTSSLSITRLAKNSGRPDLFIGMHFFNPVPAMKLVEIVRGLETSDATAAKVTALAEKFGKVPIEVNDSPGFVVNRVVMPMINEAAYVLMQGVADAKAIDECMKLGCNHPMGPLALADLVGLDVVCAILDTLHREFGVAHYKPCPLIQKYVDAGWLGTKTQRGFYQY